MSTLPARREDAAFWWCAAALAAACLAALWLHLGALPLVDPDEGRNAEVAREMLVLHDWVTPHYDFLTYLDKPAALFWLVALSYKILGVSELAARLPSALAALGCLMLAADVARRRSGPRAALWTTLILATSPLFVTFARAVIFDMPLTLCVSIAIWAFDRCVDAAPTQRVRYLVAMYTAIGAAVLVKGPVGLAIPLMVIVPTLIVTRRLRAWRDLRMGLGAAIIFVVAAPWYVMAELRHPGYLRYFLFEENVSRYLTPQFDRSGRWYFYIGVMVVGFLPWTTMMWTAGRSAVARVRERNTALLIVWIVAPVAFFSFSQSKQPGYVLPSCVPIAVLLGDAAASILNRRGRSRWPLATAAVMLAGACSCAAAWIAWPPLLPGALAARVPELMLITLHHGALPLFIAAGAAALISAGVAVRARPYICYLAMSGCLIVFYVSMLAVVQPFAQQRSMRDLAAETARLLRPDDRIAIDEIYLASLPFYLRVERPIWLASPLIRGTIAGSWYIAEKGPASPSWTGPIVFGSEAFDREWATSPGRIVVFVSDENHDDLINRLSAAAPAGLRLSPRTLLDINGVALIANK